MDQSGQLGRNDQLLPALAQVHRPSPRPRHAGQGLGRPQKLSRSRFICPWISVTSRKGSSGDWEKVRNRASAIGRLLFWAGAQVKMERLSEVIYHDPGFVKCLRKRGQTRSVAYLSDNRRIRPRGARWAG